jgi:hypothetical protein
MKKIALIVLLIISNLFGVNQLSRNIVYNTRTISTDISLEEALLKFIIECEGFTDKATQYNLDECEEHNHSIFRATNEDYALVVLFEKDTHDYEIWFYSYTENIDYARFDNLLKSVFE